MPKSRALVARLFYCLLLGHVLNPNMTSNLNNRKLIARCVFLMIGATLLCLESNTMKHKLLAIALTVGLTGITQASEIADFFSQMRTFKGDFSQTVYQDGALVQQSKGKVALKKPLIFL